MSGIFFLCALGWPFILRVIYIYSAGVRYCAGEIVWHNIDPFIVPGFFIVRVPDIVRVNGPGHKSLRILPWVLGVIIMYYTAAMLCSPAASL